MKTDLLQLLFSYSKADDLIISKIQNVSSNIRFANNSITSSGTVKDASYLLISIIKGRVGSVAIDNIQDKDTLIQVLRTSEEIAANNEIAEDAYTLCAKNKDANTYERHFSLTQDIEAVDSVADLTSRIGMIFSQLKQYNNSGFGEINLHTIFLATSKGIRRFYDSSSAKLSVTTKTTNTSQSVWEGMGGYHLGEIATEALIDSIQEDLKNGRTKLQKKAGRYTVILSPHAVTDLLLYMFMDMFSMRDCDEGRGVFSKFSNGKLVGNMIGEQLFPDYITIRSNPDALLNPSLPFLLTSASSPYASVFDNGAQIKAEEWISQGVLKNLITTRRYAHDKKLTKYALFPSNFSMDGSAKDAQDVIRETEHGLYVNCLWYIRTVDPKTGLLTGLTRDGVYVIENGEIIGSCNNFRFNESPVEMLKNTIDLSQPYVATPREFDDQDSIFPVPYLKVENFNMSSVSDAL